MNILDNTMNSQDLEAFGVRASQGSGMESTLRGVRDGSIRTLFALSGFPEGGVRTTDIAEKLQQHRSTTNTHLIELEEVGVISKIIEAGTENRIKPTYLYSIDASVDCRQLANLFEKRFPQGLLVDLLQKNPIEQAESGADQKVRALDLSSLGSPAATRSATRIESSSPPEQSQAFESQLENLLNAMAEQIVSLQSRVTELESQLSIQSSRTSAPDLSHAIKLLSRESSTARGGQHA
jgi:predicted transcriptional regulator